VTTAETAASEFVPHKNPIRRLAQHPAGFWFVFSGELAERASFYGMRTILALYMTDALGFSQGGGATVMKAFMAACYLTPFLGGWIAEHRLGRFKTILYYSLPYIVGHLVLGGVQNEAGLAVALALLALGSGAIKPNTSVLMGQIYDAKGRGALLTEAFSLYYAAVNIGSAATSLSLPLIRNRYGYGTALMIPAVLMAVAFAIFGSGFGHYPKENVREQERVPLTPEEKRARRATLRRLLSVFGIIAIFWLIYDQTADTWIYFADRHCDLTLWGSTTITPDQVAGLNPVFIIALTPVFNWLWGAWRRRRGGVELPDTRKMMVGFGIVVATTLVMTCAAFLASHGEKVSVWWVIGATFVITLAELCVSVVGMEFAYRQAAPGTKSLITAAFWMTVFVGDSIALPISPLYEKQLKPPAYFGLEAVVMTLAALAFIPISRRFEREAAARGAAQAVAARAAQA
jgi:POT family proton-dependent oligopeptide transporter